MSSPLTDHTDYYCSEEEDYKFCYCPFSTVPELAQLKILNYLSIQQVLNLRLVCNCTKEWISKYSYPYLSQRLKRFTLKFDSAQEVTTFVNFTWTPPFSSYRFNFNTLNDANKAFTKIGSSIQFVQSVHSLLVRSFHFCSTDAGYEFYHSLRNLKHLHIESMMWRRSNEPPWIISRHHSSMLMRDTNYSSQVNQKQMIPQSLLQSLESFSVEVSNQSNYIYELIMNCPKLKYLAVGKMYPCDTSLYAILEPSPDDEPTLKFKKVAEYISWRENNHKESQGNDLDLTVDMKCSDIGESSESIKKYLPYFGINGIHLVNVNESLLQLILNLKRSADSNCVENILRNIKSVTTMSPLLRKLKLINLEELNFEEVDFFYSEGWSLEDEENLNLFPFWDKLKHINASFIPSRSSSFNYMNPDNEWVAGKLRALQKFLLFHPTKRLSVISLNVITCVKFDTHIDPTFVINFPNLQKLSLTCPKWESDDYTYLFFLLGKYTKINELNLFAAVLFSDRTFMGPLNGNSDTMSDKDTSPYLLRLKYLRKLKVSYEPGKHVPVTNETISDLLFSEVLAAMPLTELHLTGITLIKVNKDVVKRALWKGSFRKTIVDYNIADLGHFF